MVEIAPGIAVDPEIRFGKPVITGTRVPVVLVLQKLASGMTAAAVMEEYELEAREVQAVLQYAAQVVALEELMIAA
jgi:uncharacterized protein (DUF433 family)